MFLCFSSSGFNNYIFLLFVLDKSASLVIEGYDSEKSKIPRCNASGCGAEVGAYLEESGTLDNRLTVEVCGLAKRGSFADRLAEMERKSWEDYRARKHQLSKEALGLVDKMAEKKSMRVVKRSEKEENETKRRHLRIFENY